MLIKYFSEIHPIKKVKIKTPIIPKSMYGLDYRIIRLANPYGPYQRPNGVLGAVTTFTYKAIKREEIQVYGDGSVVRDYIYIGYYIFCSITFDGTKSDCSR